MNLEDTVSALRAEIDAACSSSSALAREKEEREKNETSLTQVHATVREQQDRLTELLHQVCAHCTLQPTLQHVLQHTLHRTMQNTQTHTLRQVCVACMCACFSHSCIFVLVCLSISCVTRVARVCACVASYLCVCVCVCIYVPLFGRTAALYRYYMVFSFANCLTILLCSIDVYIHTTFLLSSCCLAANKNFPASLQTPGAFLKCV